MSYKVTRLANGWYCFENIPQDNHYIKIGSLRCLTDRKAINQARKIIGDSKANITIEDFAESLT